MPTAADSKAPILWSVNATAGSKDDAAASGVGKTVRKPWIVSNANRIGMCSRELTTASCWY